MNRSRASDAVRFTVRALRSFDPSKFASLFLELMSLSRQDLPADHPFARVRVMPNDVSLPPIWLLGSSGASAQFAGKMGVGYGFASHFSPAPALPALEAYRTNFEPSDEFPEPHVILAVSVVCAETDEEADYLAGSLDLNRLRLQRGDFSPLATPEEAANYPYSVAERAIIEENRKRQFIGSPETVRSELLEFARRTRADELMITTFTHSPAARLRSYELVAGAFSDLGALSA